MRIAIIIALFPPKWLAGAEIATYYLAEHLANRGHEIHILTSHDKGLPYFHIEKGFFIHRIEFPRIRIIGIILFWLKIYLIILNIKPKIVQVQSISGIPAYVAKKTLNIPYIVWGRGSDVYFPGYFTKITSKLILQTAFAALALTNDMREKMMKFYARDIMVIPNGIDLEQFTNIPSTMSKEENTNNILFVGRLHSVKGVQYLIKAMQLVLEEIPDAVLIIVGGGDEKVQLEQLSIQLGIQKSVHFVGIIAHEKIHTIMHNAKLLVLPSISEGFPSVLLEGMACGLPIIATRVGGVPEIISNKTNGFIVESENSVAIAEKIILLLYDDVLRKEISENNRQTVKNFSWDNVITKLEEIYIASLK